jgi:hypothetical protein
MFMNDIFNRPLKIKHIIYLIFFLVVVTVTIIVLGKYEVKISDVIIAFSTLIAPLAALQIQTYIEKMKIKKAKKMDVFKILMATRATPFNFEHVKALNMINIEFYGDLEVINAWKEFLDIRSRQDLSNPGKEYEDSIVNLLQKMASSLNLNFHDDEIRKGCYRPKIHVDAEALQWKIYYDISRALEDGKLHVYIDTPQQLCQEQNRVLPTA